MIRRVQPYVPLDYEIILAFLKGGVFTLEDTYIHVIIAVVSIDTDVTDPRWVPALVARASSKCGVGGS